MSAEVLVPASGLAARSAMYGWSGWSASNMLATTGNTGEPGALAGFGVYGWARVDTTPAGAVQTLFSKTNPGSTQGWTLRTASNAATINFACGNGAALIQSPSFSATLGVWTFYTGWVDGTLVRLAANGVEQGAGTAIAAYTASTAVMAIGGRGAGSLPATGITLSGWGTFTGVISAADALACYTASKKARSVSTMPTGTMSHAYRMRADGGDVGTLATVADKVGVHNMTRAGTPTFVRDKTPTF